VRVELSAQARSFVERHGGVLYVRATSTRCCRGAMTTLAATTEAPVDATSWRVLAAEGPEVRWCEGALAPPERLVVEVRGRRRPRLAAYWDGCAYRI
jgi:hypothetical protein